MNHKPVFTWLSLLSVAIFALLEAWSARAQGTTQYAVYPPTHRNVDGNLGGHMIIGPVERHQLWRGDFLAQTWQQPVRITEIAFRLNNNMSSLSVVVPRIEIRLATSQRTPENLTFDWAVNAGPDQRTVFLEEFVPINATGGGDPNSYDIRFELSEPFDYDPQAGNLVMYFSSPFPPNGVSQAQGVGVVDMLDTQSDRSMATMGGNFSGPAPFGVIAEFGTTQIPEPSVGALLCAGPLAIWIFRRKQMQK